MIALLAKLFVAHLLGDFVFFRNKRLKSKGRSIWKSRRLLLHSILHFVLAWIALSSLEFWPFALLIGASHYVTEIVSRTLWSRHPQIAFSADQIFHVLLLYVIASVINDPLWPGDVSKVHVSWVHIAGLIAVTFPAAKVIEVFLSRWPPSKAADKLKGLVSAGLWIGILERILIYIFIVSGHWEGIGFLLAAKSIFRFGDLTNSKDISLTEYIMVGTLLSFCLAVITGLAVNYLSYEI